MSFGTALQRALVEPIGLRAFQRGLQTSLVKAFACPLDRGNGGLQHPGDLSVAECLSFGVFAYIGFEQDAGSVQLARWGAARRDELVQVLPLFLAELDEVTYDLEVDGEQVRRQLHRQVWEQRGWATVAIVYQEKDADGWNGCSTSVEMTGGRRRR